MTSIALALALLGGSSVADVPLSPFEHSVIAPAETAVDATALPIDLSIVLMFGVIEEGDLDDIDALGGIDLEIDNTFYVSGAVWVGVGGHWLVEFAVKWEDETDLNDVTGTDIGDVDGIEATASLIYRFSLAGLVSPYFLIGAGYHSVDTTIGDEDDLVYVAGFGVIIGISGSTGLVIEVRYSQIDIDGADAIERIQGGVGVSIGL